MGAGAGREEGDCGWLQSQVPCGLRWAAVGVKENEHSLESRKPIHSLGKPGLLHSTHPAFFSPLTSSAPFPSLLAVSYVAEKTEAIRKDFCVPHHHTHLCLCPSSPPPLPSPPSATSQPHDNLKSWAGRLLKDSAPLSIFFSASLVSHSLSASVSLSLSSPSMILLCLSLSKLPPLGPFTFQPP